MIQGRSGPFAPGLHPRGRGGKFAAKPGHLVPKGRGGRPRTDLPPPRPKLAPKPPRQGGGPAGGAGARLGRILSSLRQFRDNSREHGVAAAAAARAYMALAKLDRLFSNPGGDSFHPAAGDPQALLDNWTAVHDSLRSMTRLATVAGPSAAGAVMQLFTGYARDDLPADERRLLEAWLRACEWDEAAGRGTPGARELAEAAEAELDALTGRERM